MAGSSDPSGALGRTPDREDRALLERLREGEKDAMASLYDQYGRLAFGLAYRVVGDPEEAEDVVQEAFLALWRQSGRLDQKRGAVRSYLMTIVHRRAIDVLRRRPERRDQALERADDIASAEPDPVDVASLAEERALVQRGLRELPAEQREAVELTYLQGCTVAELAKRAEIPLGTAKSRLRLALDRMRKTFAEQGIS